MRWIGLGVALLAILNAISLGGPVRAFVDLPGMLFVVLVGGGIIIASHGSEGLSLVVRAITKRLSAKQVRRAQNVAETGIRSFLAAAWIGFLIGIIQGLPRINEPIQIRDMLAVSSLTLLYGSVFAYLFFMPLSRSLSNVAANRSNRSPADTLHAARRDCQTHR